MVPSDPLYGLVLQLGAGGAIGFLAGYAIKKLARLVAVGLGLLILLLMVLNYYGKNVHEGDITKKIRRRGRHGGVSLSELARIAKEYYGLEAYVMMGGKLEVLKALLLNGWPPIVAYNANDSQKPTC